MEIDVNPYRSLSADIDATEFEEFCLDTLNAYAQREGLNNFSISHNQKVETFDSTYQIDLLAEYTALRCKHKVVVECKKHSRSIERSIVTDLYAKTQSIGAQKAILISTSGFQKDAVKYAGAHGIALWQICDGFIKHVVASAEPKILPHNLMLIEMEKYLPKYFVKEWDCSTDWPYEEIYPTEDMKRRAMEESGVLEKLEQYKQCLDRQTS